MNKESVVNVVKDLPQEFVLDDLIEKLIFIEKVEAGTREIEQGKGVPLEDLQSSILLPLYFHTIAKQIPHIIPHFRGAMFGPTYIACSKQKNHTSYVHLFGARRFIYHRRAGADAR